MLSTNEDGFHSNGNDIGPVIIGTTIAHNGDDNGNICAGMSVYLGQFDVIDNIPLDKVLALGSKPARYPTSGAAGLTLT